MSLAAALLLTTLIAQPPSQRVTVNGHALSSAEMGAIKKQYGVQPRPGRYWYDAKSGLYGVVGHAAFGFMRPGHRFGRLAPGASNGRTGIFINGRQLCQREWMVWSALIGVPIQPGRYWLDANGNSGYVGSRIPLVNLYAAAAKNRHRAQGGDNFWTSRFSAGNSDRGGRRGYVSVPGVGPVGYGF